ncbi:MAG TPA: YdcF family protein [Candidatus Polarisedimenticolaceae bacterium]|nr:YdcF family protein [Candidatus Polarisedimenticolaceae bacterium]
MVLPPGNLILLSLAGFLLFRRWPRVGLSLLAASSIGLVALSAPVCSSLLLRSLETYPPLTEGDYPADVQAIVILGAESYSPAREFGTDTIGGTTLERVRYGARLHRATGVPILTTGGTIRPANVPVGRAMAEVLAGEFGVPVRWTETESSNTFENAKFSAALLERDGVGKIYLVTTASHIPRAKLAFEAMGLEVVPAPTSLTRRPTPILGDFLPRIKALHDSHDAFYEWLGLWWYRLAYF